MHAHRILRRVLWAFFWMRSTLKAWLQSLCDKQSSLSYLALVKNVRMKIHTQTTPWNPFLFRRLVFNSWNKTTCTLGASPHSSLCHFTQILRKISYQTLVAIASLYTTSTCDKSVNTIPEKNVNTHYIAGIPCLYMLPTQYMSIITLNGTRSSS